MLTGIPNRVIRLAGRDSDVTALSMRKEGLHLVPIIENPSSDFAQELRACTQSSPSFHYPT